MTDRIKKYADGLLSLAVFRDLLDDEVIGAFLDLLMSADMDEQDKAQAWGEFVALVYVHGGNFSTHIRDVVLESGNPYAKMIAAGHKVPVSMRDAYSAEIDLLDSIAKIKSWELRGLLGFDQSVALPGWEVEDIELPEVYEDRVGHIDSEGYGIFSKHHVFTIEDGKLHPVMFHDQRTLDDMIGYERERSKIIQNTEALLAGLPANNVLLYGDAGTGKSSTVKALANEYADRGLRLIEVKKNQLYQIPKIVERLSEDPLKFILYIDDLSFSSNDDDFAALKAILEGSVAGGAKNIAIYATSNRRHFVKESFSDRDGDDLHRMDTIQETMSLSARFGLQVTFQRPDKELYLDIVRGLATSEGLEYDDEKLCLNAEAYAIRCGGRSPRAARNFVTSLMVAENEK